MLMLKDLDELLGVPNGLQSLSNDALFSLAMTHQTHYHGPSAT